MIPLHRRQRALLAGAAALLVAANLVPALRAWATVPEPTTTPVVGNSTYFDGLGSPYGGCGLPQSVLETQDFIALNVYDTPRDYNFYPRPLPPDQANRMGIWNNGRNCGRWVQVTVSDFCTGVNDGAANQAFCRNGSWVADSFNGATLNMLVADSCGDSNAWCRDDPYHIDLARASLGRFTRNGAPVGSLLPNNFNNRRMSWRFIPAPGYTGDIQIGFLSGAQRWWPAISVSRLPDGIHGVEYFADGAWRSAQMNSDMGQSYVIGGTTSGGTTFRIRVRDVADQLVAGGRVYEFTLPEACANQCGAAYTQVTYTVSGDQTPPNPPPPNPPPPNPPPPNPPPPNPPPPNPPPPNPPPPNPPPPNPPPPSPGGCAATYAVTQSWPGGFQAELTVRNPGTAALTGWRVSWTPSAGETISQAWNGRLVPTPPTVSVDNESWNGALGAGATAVVGLLGSSNGAPVVPAVACAAR